MKNCTVYRSGIIFGLKRTGPDRTNTLDRGLKEDNVVVEVVSMMQSALELNGFSTNLLGRGNAVILPPALFRRFNMQPATRITTVSINNRNMLRPRNRNNRLRGNILSVNVDVGDLSGLGIDERIRLNFGQVRAICSY